MFQVLYEGNVKRFLFYAGMMLYHREQRPTHYTLQIKSYSALASSKIERCESSVFEAGDYKWRLILYLHGNSEVNKDGHISLYLGIPEAQIAEQPFGWEVWAHFKFLVLDQINDKYLVIQDVQSQLKRFHSAKTEWGFDELLLMDTFKDARNGYLVGDCCTFGVEVFVATCSGKGECISTLLKPPAYDSYTWKLSNFSQIDTSFCLSESFIAGGTRWKLKVYPKGDECPR